MNRVAKTAIGITTVSLLAMSPSAKANEFTDMFKSFLNNQTGGAVNGDPISQRERTLSDRIVQAINSNRLSVAQTATVKTQYDHIKELEAQYRASGRGLDDVEIASLNSEMTKLDVQLDQMLGAGTTTTTTTTTPGYGNPMQKSPDERLTESLERITSALGSGKLTIAEATSLKVDYDKIRADKNRGMPIPQLQDEISQFHRKIRESMHDTQQWAGIDGQQAALAQRITDGVNSGKITRPEYTALKAESDRIEAEEARARQNGLQYDETLALANDLNNFHNKVEASINNSTAVNPGGQGNWGQGQGNWGQGQGNGWGNWRGWGGWGGSEYGQREKEAHKRITDALSQGKLTHDESEDLLYDLRRLNEMERSWRNSTGGLTPQQMQTLNQGLNNVMAQLNTRLNDVPNTYPEIDRRQAELGNRVDVALRSGQLSASDGAMLKSRLAFEAQVEASMRQSGGSLDSEEAGRINQDLDRIAKKIDDMTARGGGDMTQAIASRKASLLKQITDGSANGLLTPLESRVLRDQYQQIDWTQQRLSRDGKFDIADQRQISAQLDNLSTLITQELADRERSGHRDYRQYGAGDRH